MWCARVPITQLVIHFMFRPTTGLNSSNFVYVYRSIGLARLNTEALSIFTRIAVPAALFSGQDIDPIFEVLQVLPFLEVLFITTGLAANLRVAQFIVSG
jgi:hypothetical protein